MSRKWLTLLCGWFLFVLLVISQIPAIDHYTDEVKNGADQQLNGGAQLASAGALKPNHTKKLNQSLMNKIKEEADKRKLPPINAKVDSVWKAIQGYDGREVDIERTYRLAVKHPNEPIKYLYKAIKPSVTLDQIMPQPIYKGNPEKPMVALMINVAWGNEFIEPMLKTLKDKQAKATFFFDGSWLSKNKETAKLIQAQGHELSNHAYSHPNMSQLSESQAEQQIVKTEALLKELNVKNNWFAPPSGDFDQETVRIAHKLGLKTVLWTIDTVDWKKPSSAWIIRKISTRLEPGSMILMHPTASASGALGQMIDEIKGKGYTLGTVSELLSTERIPESLPKG